MSEKYTAVRDLCLIRLERNRTEYKKGSLYIPVTSSPIPEAEVVEVLAVGPDVNTVCPGDFIIVKDCDTRMMPEKDLRVIPERLVHATVAAGTQLEARDTEFDHAYDMAVK